MLLLRLALFGLLAGCVDRALFLPNVDGERPDLAVIGPADDLATPTPSTPDLEVIGPVDDLATTILVNPDLLAPDPELFEPVAMVPAIGYAVASDDSFLYLVGGRSIPTNQPLPVIRYSPADNSTVSLGTLLHPRWRAGAVVQGGMLYVIGGAETPNTPSERFDLTTGVSSPYDLPGGERNYATAFRAGNSIGVAGGFVADSDPVDYLSLILRLATDATPLLSRAHLAITRRYPIVVPLDVTYWVVGGAKPQMPGEWGWRIDVEDCDFGVGCNVVGELPTLDGDPPVMVGGGGRSGEHAYFFAATTQGFATLRLHPKTQTWARLPGTFVNDMTRAANIGETIYLVTSGRISRFQPPKP